MSEIKLKNKSTKDLILEAAFSFCKNPQMAGFSMSDLAKKVGISKAAIYRHYKGKDNVLEAMDEYFFDTLAESLLQIQGGSKDEKTEDSNIHFENIISLFVTHPEFVNFFISKSSMEDNYSKTLSRAMEERGITLLKPLLYGEEGSSFEENEHFLRLIQIFYCGTTIFILIKIREKLLDEGKKVSSVEEFSKKLVTYFLKGFRGILRGEKDYHFEYITEKRFEELDQLCKVDSNDFPPEERYLTALARVIRKYKITGVTVEKLAEEMNLAKSSLYSHFENKNKMIVSQISKELSLMQMIIFENVAEGKNISEYLYIMMKTELDFFTVRPSIIPICGWLLMQNPVNPFFVDKKELVENEKILEESLKRVPDCLNIGIPITCEIFEFWIGSLPIALIAQGQKDLALKEEKYNQALRIMYHFILDGIENN